MENRSFAGRDAPRNDSQIDELVQACATLSAQMAALAEQIKEQRVLPPPAARQDEAGRPPGAPDPLQAGAPQSSAPRGDAPPVTPLTPLLTKRNPNLDAEVDYILAEMHYMQMRTIRADTQQALRYDASPSRAAQQRGKASVEPQHAQWERRTEVPVTPHPKSAPPPPQPPPRETENTKEAYAMPPENEKRKPRAWSIVGNILFYGMLVLLVVGVFIIRTSSNGAPVSLAGYTAQIVLTGSMEDAIPQGSLVVSKRVDPATLQVGDDITYLASQTTTITHRIVGILEKYADTDQRAFQTQGIMNSEPDLTYVPAGNVVGKVVFHSVALGRCVEFVSNNWPLLLFLLVLLIVFIKVMQRIMRKANDPDNASQPDGGEVLYRKKRKW